MHKIPEKGRWFNVNKPVFAVLLFCGMFNAVIGQDLEYLAPVISKYVNRDTGTSLILTQSNHGRFEGNLGIKPYLQAVQIIDAEQPWPPRWYSATPLYTKAMFEKDSAEGFARFDYIVDVKVVSGYFSFYKLLSRPDLKGGPLENPELASYLLLNDKMQCVDTVKTNKKVGNLYFRSISINSKGEKLVSLKRDVHLDLHLYSQNPADTAVHCEVDIIEILDARDSVVFLWNPMDHLDPKLFRIKESLSGRAFGYANTDIIQWTRLTNAEWDYDGNILYSMLLYGIGKISRNDGHLIWQINSTQMPLVTGKDTLQWYHQHDFKYLYETDSTAAYSLYSNGLKAADGSDSISSSGVVFELDKESHAVKGFRYLTPRARFVAAGQGSCDFNIVNGNYLISYGNLKKPLSAGGSFADDFEYGRNDSLYGIYQFPLGINCFKAHRLENFKRPPRPTIVLVGDELVASGENMDSFTWYRLSGDHNTVVEKTGIGSKLKCVDGYTYCVAGKYGMGYSVSVPYLVKKEHHYLMLLLVVCGCILFGFAGMKFLNRNPVNRMSRQ